MIRLAKDEAMEELVWEQERLEAFAGCAMCKLAHPSSEPVRVAESEHGVVALDGFAATRGHLLVIARHHVERGAELPWPVYCDLQRLVWESTLAVEHALKPARVYVAALGSSSQLPMSFPHFHIHVVPVYETGERARPAHVLSWSSGVIRYQAEEADELVQRLKRAWPPGLQQQAHSAAPLQAPSVNRGMVRQHPGAQ